MRTTSPINHWVSKGNDVWGWVRIGCVLVTLVAGWVRMETRVAAAEAKAASVSEDIKAIREAIGDIQLDMGMICAATFSPKDCYTSGKGRSQ